MVRCQQPPPTSSILVEPLQTILPIQVLRWSSILPFSSSLLCIVHFLSTPFSLLVALVSPLSLPIPSPSLGHPLHHHWPPTYSSASIIVITIITIVVAIVISVASGPPVQC